MAFLFTESSTTLASLAFIAGITAVAAAINSVAGGGRILTFSALAAILPADPSRLVIANATSTVGLWPGTLSAAWEYRHERAGQPKWSLWLLLPSIAGAFWAHFLFLSYQQRNFDSIVPCTHSLGGYSLCYAAIPLKTSVEKFDCKEGNSTTPKTKTLLTAASLQFFIGMYGGYFGAGNGILMLAVLGGLGLGDTHRLNAFKNLLAMVINACAALTFALTSFTSNPIVAWLEVGIMAIAAIIGGLVGGRLARQYHPNTIRAFIAVIGYGLAVYYFLT